METQPTLYTERTCLRAFTLADAPPLHRLASHPAVAPETYFMEENGEVGAAETWIQGCHDDYRNGERLNYAITRRCDETLLGAVELTFRRQLPYKDAALGYWIGRPYWNRGYCTEAARALIAHGFHAYDLESIFADYAPRNPASGRVMQKIGMRFSYNLPRDPTDTGSEDRVRYKIFKQDFIAAANDS